MAIEQLGESLLARQRGQMVDDRKRREKEMRRMRNYALATAGINIANKALASHAQSFVEREEVAKGRVLYRQQIANKEELERTMKEIDASGKGAQTYFEEKFMPYYQGVANENTPDDNADYTAQWARNQARESARKAAEAFQKAYDYSTGITNMEELDASLVSAARKARPSNVGSWLISKTTNWRENTTPKQREEQILDALLDPENGRYANAEALKTAMETYRKTQDLSLAVKAGDLIVPDEPDPEWQTINEEQMITTVNNRLVTMNKVTERNRNNPTQTRSRLSKANEIDYSDSVTDNDKLETLRTSFNPAKDAKLYLSDEGVGKFVQYMLDNHTIAVPAITTLNEWKIASTELAKFARDNPELRRDGVSEEIIKATATAISQTIATKSATALAGTTEELMAVATTLVDANNVAREAYYVNTTGASGEVSDGRPGVGNPYRNLSKDQLQNLLRMDIEETRGSRLTETQLNQIQEVVDYYARMGQ